jgi:hypothetical protein
MGMFDPSSYDDDSSSLPTSKIEVEGADFLERIQEHALDVVLLQQRYKDAKLALDVATEGLAMALPPAMREVGEHAVKTESLLVQATVAEKMTWDQDIMADLYKGPDDLPECMNVRFAVTKTRYEKASQVDRDRLAHALTRSAAKPKFKIEAT